MEEKVKGDRRYEIAIVILVLLLFWTIRYPSSVWEEEANRTNICRTRMESIQQLELRYITLTNTYTDSMPELIDVVTADSNSLVSLDSVVLWDDIIKKKKLKKLIYNKSFPEEIQQLIDDKLMNGKPLGNLSNYDSLELRLTKELQEIFASFDSTYTSAALDSGVVWQNLLGENIYLNILETTEMPRSISRSTNRALRKGTPIFKTAGWDSIRPVFYDSLTNMVSRALRTDIWKPDKRDQWEKVRRKQWEEEMDTLSVEERDTVWQEYQRKYWEKQNDLMWKNEREKLWKKERKNWIELNEATWNRIASQKWQAERKQNWLEDEKMKMESAYKSWFKSRVKPVVKQIQQQITEVDSVEDEFTFIDSVITNNLVEGDTFEVQPVWGKIYTVDKVTFSGIGLDDFKSDLVDMVERNGWDDIQQIYTTIKDSIWRTQTDTLWSVEKKRWLRKNKKEVRDIQKNVWNSERRVTWDPEAFERWKKEKSKKQKELWKELKEELWNLNKDNFWSEEEAKLSMKIRALKNLDQSVVWIQVLGNEKVESIINALRLPNTGALWKSIQKAKKENGSSLYQLGLVELYRNILLDSLSLCPVSHTPYVIGVVDTTAIKKLTISCPIIDETRKIRAYNINPVTKDTTKIKLRVPIFRKLFAGGSIKNHGKIDEDGKKSWETRGR